MYDIDTKTFTRQLNKFNIVYANVTSLQAEHIFRQEHISFKEYR